MIDKSRISKECSKDQHLQQFLRFEFSRYFRTRKKRKKRVKFAITVYQMVYHICALSVVITFVKLWLPPSYDAAGFSRDR